MAALSEEVEPSTLGVYAQQLQRCLQWDPVNGAEGQNKQVFVEALTEIAALPLDSISMEIRRLLHVHLRNIIAALSARDVQLKCKAANAVGSLCISRVAGQQLLGIYGEQILKSVSKMATRKNQWVQGDAFFVLGWMVVIADEETLTAIAELLPTVIKHLHRNMASRRSKAALASSEQASNFRVYALVLLLNFSQRHVDVFAEQLEQALPMLKDLILKLLEPLTITLLSVLVDQLEGTASRLLDLKVLPSLLKLKRVLETSEACELVGDTGIQEITERLDAVIETLLNCR
ncbi:uncharacterized protein PITG_05868 [Phytophthora infestans T30-4]|uniref:Uncharacterized protein n=1 Tax=Phytophthora infestans (strain T30-4) TaxID=403677 RepID=D0N5V9_PHYIT|nr:uncharacterized protein PITG_05868 [Phytophthora infestans T30-4]EEY70450.1 conserved hypothetical protein [Phytophthora infestans T30-4]|eukprot:XP_002998104.1 conserved hypothetical protein [Phytophthora infestans T30-4]